MPSMASEAIKRRHFAPRNVLSLVDRFSRFGDSGSRAYGENLLGSVCVLLNRNPGTWPTNFHRTLAPEFHKQGSRETISTS